MTKMWSLVCLQVLSEKSKGKAKDLLGDSWEYIHVQLTTVKIPERTTPKPIPISLPHPIYSTEDGFSMCIIVKVCHQRPWRQSAMRYLPLYPGSVD